MSEQDFFFDEEDDAKPAAKKAQATKAQAPARASSAAATPLFEQNVSMSIAALMAVIALLLGVIVGVLIPTGSTAPAVTSGSPASVSGAGTAPQLTEEQLNSGAMPAGHPEVPGAAGSQAATGSEVATGN